MKVEISDLCWLIEQLENKLKWAYYAQKCGKPYYPIPPTLSKNGTMFIPESDYEAHVQDLREGLLELYGPPIPDFPTPLELLDEIARTYGPQIN